MKILARRHTGWLFAWLAAWAVGPAAASSSSYDFAYALSGDRRVAPIQVFDDGQTTWLQFAPGQLMPAVFRLQGQADDAGQWVAAEPQGSYLALPGTAPGWLMRVGDVSARADYLGPPRASVDPGLSAPALALVPVIPARTTAAAVQAAQSPRAETSEGAETARRSGVAGDVTHVALPVAGPSSASASAASSSVATPADFDHAPLLSSRPITGASATPALALAPAVNDVETEPQASLPSFHAQLADTHLRGTLRRWAQASGWTFEPEHWGANVDIPLAANAAFTGDFRTAVRALLASTELTEHPLQPCFYANQVLRVIPFTQRCDRRVAAWAAVQP